ncbi:ComEA family DNA-binding protein [Corynebacterium breve]|uniref:ComEA family DNA-binding protein n=1 Tax=Corynebacterium breve TaxID=3049799 RepID=A0ABY8VCU1_9CORY|nr:ComEA family DNA-binding protein [Corynebacterium breve]WIM67152.1 ComEA family DNA-binding protein [Corynebacterium breve]
MRSVDRLKELTRPTGEEDLLRVEYPAPRWKIEPRVALACAGLLAVLLGAWWLGQPRVAEPIDSAHDWASALSTTTDPAESEEPAEIVVSVVGRVEHPGLVTLQRGQRVADALDQAVVLGDADTVSLNLAQVLADGQQIYVPEVGEAAPLPAPHAEAEAGSISLNSAGAAELMELDGVGDATAAAIIAHRDQIGGFTEIEQLLDVKGIGPAKFEAIKGEVSL